MKYKSSEEGKVVQRQTHSKKILLGLDDFKEKGHLLQIVTIPPRDLSIKERFHYHNVQTEVYYVLEGVAEVFLNEEKFDAKPGDAFILEPGEKHHIMNRSEQDFKIAVFKINLPEDSDDTVYVE